MPKFQFFYDYECPFCKRGYELLVDLLPAYPEMEVEWRPVELNPRPETQQSNAGPCIQAYYIARELGADINAFHKKMFQAVAIERQYVRKDEVLAKVLEGIVDSGKFLEILKSGKYAPNVKENNDLAYEKNGVWYVTAFRITGADSKDAPRLDARGGRGVTQEGIKDFLDRIKGS